LIAVTKFLPAEVIRIAYQAGIRDFGESRVQEASAKTKRTRKIYQISPGISLVICKLTRSAKLVEHFQWIHSVDTLKLAQKLNQMALDLQCTPQCCLQVKMVPDPPKYGFDD
jgi:uncharacterized pyridoxal phosphate-containing UPF0001 family protein